MKLDFNISSENEETGELDHFNFQMNVPKESEEDARKFLEHMNDFEDIEIHEVE